MKSITRFLQVATLLSATAFIISVLFQIYARVFMNTAPPWTEEASRFFFIYAMSFAAGLAVKDNEYVFLDVFYNKLSSTFKNVIDISVPVVVTGLFTMLGIASLKYIQLGISESSSSINISMAWAFTSILVMAMSVTLFSVKEVVNQIKAKK